MKIIRSPFLIYTLLIPIWSFSQYTASGDLTLKVYANIILEQRESEAFNLVKGTTQEGFNIGSEAEFGILTPALAIYRPGGHICSTMFIWLVLMAMVTWSGAGIRRPRIHPIPGRRPSTEFPCNTCQVDKSAVTVGEVGLVISRQLFFEYLRLLR